MFINLQGPCPQALKTNQDTIPATHAGKLDAIFGALCRLMSSKNEIFVISHHMKVETPPEAREPLHKVQNEPRMCHARLPSPVGHENCLQVMMQVIFEKRARKGLSRDDSDEVSYLYVHSFVCCALSGEDVSKIPFFHHVQDDLHKESSGELSDDDAYGVR